MQRQRAHHSESGSSAPGEALDARSPGKRTRVEAVLPVQARAPAGAVLGGPAKPGALVSARSMLQMMFGAHTARSEAAAQGDHSDGAAHAAAARGVATAATGVPHAEAIQRSFGRHDISGVQAHVGPEASASAKAMNADAYATGNHVVFARAPDLHTAAHEVAHVVQQRGGVQLKGGVGQHGDAYEQHADAVADRVVRGESAEALLDQHGGGGGPAVQRKFAAQHGDKVFIDQDTGQAYDLIRRTESTLIVKRESDDFEVRVDAATMEPIENEHQRGFRLRKEPEYRTPLVDLESYQPPSVATLYQRNFPNGKTFRHQSVEEAFELHERDIAYVRALAVEVEQLKTRARANDQAARNALPAKGAALQSAGDKLTQILFGHVESYQDFLFLMDQFVAGKLPSNPVYNGVLWSETNDLIGQLREITRAGITTWESQPSNQEHVIPGTSVTERQFGFLELSGPKDLVNGLAKQLASVSNITIIHPGDTRRVPMKQLRGRSQQDVAALIGGSPDFAPTPPVKKGSRYETNWLDSIANNAKYIGRATTSVPSLKGVIGGHTYLYLVSKDADAPTALFDTVCALLPKVKPVEPKPVTDDDPGHEHDAERDHQQGYATTAGHGNLVD